MFFLMATDFNEEAESQAPQGEGDPGGGTWQIEPPDSCHCIPNPSFSGSDDKVLCLNGDVGSGVFEKAIYNFQYDALGKVGLIGGFMMEDPGSSTFGNFDLAFLNDDERLAGIRFADDGFMHVLRSGESLPLHKIEIGTISGDENLEDLSVFSMGNLSFNTNTSYMNGIFSSSPDVVDATFEPGKWIYLFLFVTMDELNNPCMIGFLVEDLKFDKTLHVLLYPGKENWTPALPLIDISKRIDALEFQVDDNVQWYIDNQMVITNNIDYIPTGELDPAPEGITFVNGGMVEHFNGQAKVSIETDGMGNDAMGNDVTNEVPYLLDDSIKERVWQFPNLLPATYRIFLDFWGPTYFPMRFLAFGGHNFGEFTMTEGDQQGELEYIRVFGSNSTTFNPQDTEFYIDISNLHENPWILCWLPEHSPCRYYGIEVRANGTFFTTEPLPELPANLQVGRIMAAPNTCTPSIGPSYKVKQAINDRSIVLDKKAGIRYSMLREPAISLDLKWNALPSEDADDLIWNHLAAGGVWYPWLVMSNPADDPEDIFYAYWDDNTLKTKMNNEKFNALSLKFLEINN